MKYHRDVYLLLGLHILAYTGLITLILYGNVYEWLLTLFMYFVYGCLGSSVTFHRLLAHRSWTSPRWFTILGTLAGTMAMIGSSISWVSLHYDHHRYTDKEGDPHSPKNSLIDSYLGGIFKEPNVRRAPHLLRDPLHMFLHKNYFYIHLFVLIILCIIDPMLAVFIYLAPAALVLMIGGILNIFAHRLGYITYQINDDSKNNFVFGYIMWGEGWHNNHHAHPQSPQIGEQWWELDIGNWVIKQVNIKSKEG